MRPPSEKWETPSEKCAYENINLPASLGYAVGNNFKKKLDLQSTVAPVEDLVSDLQLYRISSPFDRRCTALEWHPTNTNKLAVGSKGGDIILWDIESTNNDAFVHGVKYFTIYAGQRLRASNLRS